MGDIIVKHGGNGEVKIDLVKQIATKTLKKGKKGESFERYKKEIEALKVIKDIKSDHIVKIYNLDEHDNKIIMKAYKGDLSETFNSTQNNPLLACNLLKQLVEALKALAELEHPIYHRDLKPANILYDEINGEVKLYISDFGCCYFEQEDNRTTPEFRAVGAQSYRAPEYDYGKVENVDEKGDVYSLGKILWAMVNGVKNDIFPYTLWYPEEYNLTNRCNNSIQVMKVNLIVAKCVSVKPEDRPTYDELIGLLEAVGEVENIEDVQKEIRVKTFSAKREVELSEVREMNAEMLNIFYEDFNEALKIITQKYISLTMINHILNEFSSSYTGRQHHIKYKIINDVASYIFSASYDNIYLALDYHPTYSKNTGSKDDKYASISGSYTISSNKATNHFEIQFQDMKLYIRYKDNETLYNRNILELFLEDMIEQYMNAFER